MGRRRVIAVVVVLAVAAGAAALVLALTGGGTRSQRPGLAAIADRVVRGATAVLTRAEQATAGAQGLHVVLPDAVIHPPAGSGPPSRDSTAAAVYAGAGWRAALIAAAAALGVPALTDFVATDRAGAQAPGAAFYLDGTVRTAPGQSMAAGMARLGRVSGAAARQQLDDNLRVLRAGLPRGSLLAATVTPIAVAGGTAFAVELRIGDLRRLTSHFGDLLSGLATGLAPGPNSTVEGLAVHAVDAGGRNIGSWMATRARQGTTVIDPRIRPPVLLVPRLAFVDETGGPVAVPSAHAGPAGGGGA
jgi:hypothetical protein